jgi:hypothetical protein
MAGKIQYQQVRLRLLRKATIARRVLPFGLIILLVNILITVQRIFMALTNPESMGLFGNEVAWDKALFIIDEIFRTTWFAFILLVLFVIPKMIDALLDLEGNFKEKLGSRERENLKPG